MKNFSRRKQRFNLNRSIIETKKQSKKFLVTKKIKQFNIPNEPIELISFFKRESL